MGAVAAANVVAVYAMLDAAFATAFTTIRHPVRIQRNLVRKSFHLGTPMAAQFHSFTPATKHFRASGALHHGHFPVRAPFVRVPKGTPVRAACVRGGAEGPHVRAACVRVAAGPPVRATGVRVGAEGPPVRAACVRGAEGPSVRVALKPHVQAIFCPGEAASNPGGQLNLMANGGKVAGPGNRILN